MTHDFNEGQIKLNNINKELDQLKAINELVSPYLTKYSSF